MQRNIVIVGYPKSGTTWMARLVAELIGCPLQGNWGFSHDLNLMAEGLDRPANYACYKSHHQLRDVHPAGKQEIDTLIYVIRDPRDIVFSGLHYFQFDFPKPQQLLKRFGLNGLLYPTGRKLLNRSKRLKKRKMINAILNGDDTVNRWCAVSWEQHFKPYLENGVLFVKYEDVLRDPVMECKKILSRLHIEKNETQIANAIATQSFETRRTVKEVMPNLLRKGGMGYWKESLSPLEQDEFKTKLGVSLAHFRYE